MPHGFTTRSKGKWLVANLFRPSTNGITAHAGGGQTSAVQLNYGFSRATIVASGNDSVKAPKALAGAEFTFKNAAAANSANLYPTSGDAFNALSADSAFAVAANKMVIARCFVDGTWDTILTA